MPESIVLKSDHVSPRARAHSSFRPGARRSDQDPRNGLPRNLLNSASKVLSACSGFHRALDWLLIGSTRNVSNHGFAEDKLSGRSFFVTVCARISIICTLVFLQRALFLLLWVPAVLVDGRARLALASLEDP